MLSLRKWTAKKAHFPPKVKLNRSLWFFTGPHRPNLFPMWPASQKELPTSALETCSWLYLLYTSVIFSNKNEIPQLLFFLKEKKHFEIETIYRAVFEVYTMPSLFAFSSSIWQLTLFKKSNIYPLSIVSVVQNSVTRNSNKT